jgi:DNA-binding transcriptional ArsR family regulator
MSLPAISKHLRVLEDAGLISKKKSGRSRVCHLEVEPLQKVASWTGFYKSFWDIRLDRLPESSG